MDRTQFIKESCVHQFAETPEDFIGMTLAYSFIEGRRNAQLYRIGHEPRPMLVLQMEFINILARLINNNPSLTYRTTPVTFANGNMGAAPEFIARQTEMLVAQANQQNITPEEFYQLFEEIHPFSDGNGCVGALLYNWFNGTLEDPIHPPAFKDNHQLRL